MPRYIKDSTMSNYINGLKNGTRYRESGLVHCPRKSLPPILSRRSGIVKEAVVQVTVH